MTTLQKSIETYIHAKDGNRPHLMAEAFTPDAELTMDVKTAEIAFPPAVKGLNAISAVLVSQFAQRYENVYTFCIGAPPITDETFACDWLVCMTEKDTAAARAGFGQYEWQCDDGRVFKLRITIEEMTTLPEESSEVILGWARNLPYPWCPRALLAQQAPALDAISCVLKALG
ncbi:hypothetical protein [Caballeronia sp.]|uniref:hypothetical protein n=1 Tax=Caballeronia sp. TaxID=1931223 RepID=UPI003C402085